MNDNSNATIERVEAATALMPYFHIPVNEPENEESDD
jgi:hypothetical protein